MKVKIKNKKKFKRSMFILISLITFAVVLLSNQVFSRQETKTKTLYISKGDTLWNIAKREQQTNNFYENKTIREIIQNIKVTNNLQSSSIYEGQKIILQYN